MIKFFYTTLALCLITVACGGSVEPVESTSVGQGGQGGAGPDCVQAAIDGKQQCVEPCSKEVECVEPLECFYYDSEHGYCFEVLTQS